MMLLPKGPTQPWRMALNLSLTSCSLILACDSSRVLGTRPWRLCARVERAAGVDGEALVPTVRMRETTSLRRSCFLCDNVFIVCNAHSGCQHLNTYSLCGRLKRPLRVLAL